MYLFAQEVLWSELVHTGLKCRFGDVFSDRKEHINSSAFSELTIVTIVKYIAECVGINLKHRAVRFPGLVVSLSV